MNRIVIDSIELWFYLFPFDVVIIEAKQSATVFHAVDPVFASGGRRTHLVVVSRIALVHPNFAHVLILFDSIALADQPYESEQLLIIENLLRVSVHDCERKKEVLLQFHSIICRDKRASCL